MAIFSNLFATSSNIKKQLGALYVPMYQMTMGLTLDQAKDTFHNLYNQAEKEAEAEGTIKFPVNMGDILLKKESTDKKVESMLADKRKEGVRDKDIKWWWNMHDLVRRMMVKDDDMHKTIMAHHYIEKGMTPKKATGEIKKRYPIYGDSRDTNTSAIDGKPLPFELKDRINIYVQKKTQANPEIFKKEISESASFNTLIREEIKKGNV